MKAEQRGPVLETAALGLPSPRTPDPINAPPLRWGILGTGWIATRFVAALRSSTRQTVQAVGSRTPEKARAFADSAGLATAHGSYADLVADPDVDVVYVGTPHGWHHADARLALEAGKHVVVEKPMGLTARECLDLGDLARGRGLLLTEAMWTLFLPKYDVVRQLLEDEALGTIQAVSADIGEHFDPGHRILRADLHGGPLNDLGTYPLMLATWLLGPPSEVVAVSVPAPAHLSQSGVDGQVAMALRTATGAVATLSASVLADSPTTATVVGSRGTLTLDGPFYRPGPFTFLPHGGTPLRYDEPRVAHGALHFQAAEVARRVWAGETSTPIRPVDDTVTTMAAMDAVRLSLSRLVAPPEVSR